MDEGIHVYPTFGKPHDLTPKCWCSPSLDRSKFGECIWIHNLEN